MGAGHDHGVKSLGEQHRGRLWAALTITTTVMLAEVVGGLWSGSLSLISDAGHMGTDALGIAMALAAIIAVRRAAGHPRRTFGLYRLEVVAALGNTLLLFGVAIWVVYESIGRFSSPPEVEPIPMLIVGSIGLVANLVSLLMLQSGAKESINVKGAYLEVLGDLLGSAGVLVAAVIILTTGWWYADPIIAIAIGLFILPRAAKLGRDALRIMLQTAPAHLDIKAVTTTLESVAGVHNVHDLHVWTLTSGMDVASAHLTITRNADLGQVLATARKALHDEYHISHATLQVEPDDSTSECEMLSW